MTEQEIVNCLKENKSKGIAFGFLPEEVKDWCKIRYSNIFQYFSKYDGKENKNGMWKIMSNESYEFAADEIICLPDDYELPQKPSGEWVEFEIADGLFYYKTLDKNVMEVCGKKYYWFQVEEFLCRYIAEGFVTFGGWQYEGCTTWFVTPRLNVESPNGTIYQDSFNVDNYAECDCKPAIPIRIRFWREK